MGKDPIKLCLKTFTLGWPLWNICVTNDTDMFHLS